MQEGTHIDYVRVFPPATDAESEEDTLSFLQEIVLTQLGKVPFNSTLRIIHANSIQDAIIEECTTNDYDLVIIGSTYEVNEESLFGAVCDKIVEEVPCSVLIVRRYESATTAWLHHQTVRMHRY